jgi:hypothetical protein
MTLIPTTAQLRDQAERCRRLARGIDDTFAAQRLTALANEYAAEADKQAANERRE